MLKYNCPTLVLLVIPSLFAGCEVPTGTASSVTLLTSSGSPSPSPSPTSTSTVTPSPTPSAVTGFGTKNSISIPFGQALAIQSPTIAVQSDGKFLYVGGTNSGGGGDNGSELEIVRYNSDGTVDTSFGHNGISTVAIGTNSYLIGVAVQPDQKIVASGYSYNNDAIVVRFNSDGSVDSSFAPVDAGLGGFMFPTVQADGKILVSALNGGIFRFNSNGSLDDVFGGNGVQDGSVHNGTHWAGIYHGAPFALRPDQKIVVCGNTPFYEGIGSSSFANLVRLNSDGTLDTSFGVSGAIPAPIFGASPCSAIVLQSDGKIVMGGDFWYANTGDPRTGVMGSYYIARFNPDGSLDSSFATNGVHSSVFPSVSSTGNMTTLTVLPNGEIFGAGIGGSVLLTSSGLVDSSYVDSIPGQHTFAASALTPSGELLVSFNWSVFLVQP